MLLLQEASTIHQVADWLVPLGILAVTIVAQVVTGNRNSKSISEATGRFLGATEQRFVAVERDVNEIKQEQTQQWQSIGRTSNDLAELRGKVNAKTASSHG
jgi:hypothetical protein